ncbi:MAG: hypothetical protein ABIQ73_27345 [Acidimicrobiales bacterium]
MRATTAGVLRRIDLTPAIDLLPELFQQWNELHFDQSGEVLDAPPGTALSRLVLVEGRHRQADSRYVVTLDEPVVVTLKHDDSYTIAATISDERRRWAVDVEIGRARLPTIDLAIRVDLVAATSTDGTPGRMSRLLGESGEGRATIDLRPIEGKGGTLVDAHGRMNRFRGTARGEVDTGAENWSVDAAVSVRGRGLGRVVMLLAGRRVRRHFEHRFEQFWRTSDARIIRAERALQHLAAAVQREGGEGPLVRRALRDPDFDRFSLR